MSFPRQTERLLFDEVTRVKCLAGTQHTWELNTRWRVLPKVLTAPPEVSLPVTGVSLAGSPLPGLTPPQEPHLQTSPWLLPLPAMIHHIFSSSTSTIIVSQDSSLLSSYSLCPSDSLTGDFQLGRLPASGTDPGRAPSWRSLRNSLPKTQLEGWDVSLKSQHSILLTPEQGYGDSPPPPQLYCPPLPLPLGLGLPR